MSHEDAGHYAAKHPHQTTMDHRIAAAIRDKIADNRITCAAAHHIASQLGVTPSQVGMHIDLLEARIAKCQLGLFGYHPQKKVVKRAESVSQTLMQALQTSLVQERISCAACWEISAKLDLNKMAVSAACEKLKIKIAPCQLGAFG